MQYALHLCHMALKRTLYAKLVIGGLVDLLESAIGTARVGAAPIGSQPINHVTRDCITLPIRGQSSIYIYHHILLCFVCKHITINTALTTIPCDATQNYNQLFCQCMVTLAVECVLGRATSISMQSVLPPTSELNHQVRVKTGSGHPGHIFSGSSGSDPLYKISGSDPD